MLLLLLLIFPGSYGLNAQTMQFQLVVEEEFAILDLSIIELTGLSPGHGNVRINHSDSAAGSFRITAAENINLLVSFEAPETLMLDPQNIIPLSIRAAFQNDNLMNPSDANAFDGNTACFPVSDSGFLVENMDAMQHKLWTLISFFGEMHIGDIEPGVYVGYVTVRVEYQ